MLEGSRAVAPTKRKATFGQRAFWWFLLRVLTFTLVPLLRMSATGWRHLPRKEPYVFLSNHVTWVDPFAIWHNERSTLGFGDAHAEKHNWVDQSTIDMSENQTFFQAVYSTDSGDDLDYMILAYPYARLL